MIRPKLKQVYDFIEQYIQTYNYAPTMAEIAEGIGIKSRGVVHRLVHELVEAQWLAINPGRHRNIELARPPAANESMEIPLLGKIAAGYPIQAVSTPETVDIAYTLLGSHRYALKVQGDSMLEEGIYDGDLVICEQAESANDGEIVVALVHNESATLKRFKNNNDGTITLFPANANHSPQHYAVNDVQIQGVMVGLLRLTM